MARTILRARHIPGYGDGPRQRSRLSLPEHISEVVDENRPPYPERQPAWDEAFHAPD